MKISLDDVSAIYDNIHKDYERSESSSPGKASLIEQFKHFLEQSEPRSVLDLGCGSGVFAIEAKQSGAGHVYGIDISSEQIRLAREKAKALCLEIDYEVSDISSLKLKNEFDVVVSAFGFCYAQTEDILLEQLMVANRHLRSGGECFMVVCDPGHPLRESGSSYRTLLESKELKDGAALKCEFIAKGEVVATDYKAYWTKDTWEKLLGLAGFQDLEWSEINSKATNIVLYTSKA